MGLGRAAGATGRFTAGTIFAAVTTFFTLENTCQAAEIERLQRLEIDWTILGLTEEEILDLSDSLEGTLPEDYRGRLDERYQRRRLLSATAKKQLE